MKIMMADCKLSPRVTGGLTESKVHNAQINCNLHIFGAFDNVQKGGTKQKKDNNLAIHLRNKQKKSSHILLRA